MGRDTLDDYARLTMDFCEEVSIAKGFVEVQQKIIKAIAGLGYEYLTCAALVPPGNSPLAGVLYNNRPAEYVCRYLEKEYTLIDPVVTHLRHTLQPYSWSDVRDNTHLSKNELAIMDEATEFNVQNGIVVPIISSSGAISLFSPCGAKPDLSQRARAAISVIGIAAHQALQRAAAETRRNQVGVEPLTRREREVLKWVVHGKTDTEIAEILHIRPMTVQQHVENARRKFSAVNRVYLVVEAIRRSELIF